MPYDQGADLDFHADALIAFHSQLCRAYCAIRKQFRKPGGAMNRRTFFITIGSKTLAAGVGAAAVPALLAAPERKLKIGYTCITWGTFPRGPEASATLEAAVKDISGLGFYGFETFPEILEDWDARGALRGLIDRFGVPLTSGYI